MVAQAYRALNQIRIKAMNRAGKGTHQWRALKHFWKLILTPAGLLLNMITIGHAIILVTLSLLTLK